MFIKNIYFIKTLSLLPRVFSRLLKITFSSVIHYNLKKLFPTVVRLVPFLRLQSFSTLRIKNNESTGSVITGHNQLAAGQLQVKRIIPTIRNLLYRSVIYWPNFLGYSQKYKLEHWFQTQILLKQLKHVTLQNKSELLLQFFKRNVSLTLYTPKVFPLINKNFFLSSEIWRNWNKTNSSNLLYSFSTGRCGFKPNETKSFIAVSTTIKAGLWLIKRNEKKLTPLKLNMSGLTAKLKAHYHSIMLLDSFMQYFDSTPIPFNGCLLLKIGRKRFRRVEYNVKKVASFMKSMYKRY